MIQAKTITRLLGILSLVALAVGPVAASAHTIKLKNERTGADSKNRNRVTITETRSVTRTTVNTVNNSVGISVNTGGNTSHHNTDGGEVDSGNVDLRLDIRNNL